MRQLYQIPTRTNTAMLRYIRIHPTVYELRQQPHHLHTNTRPALHERHQPRHHSPTNRNQRHSVPGTTRMTPHNIILQLYQILITNPILRHRTKTRVNPIYHLVTLEPLQKPVTRRHTLHITPLQRHSTAGIQYPINILKSQIHHYPFTTTRKSTLFSSLTRPYPTLHNVKTNTPTPNPP